jgi:hypothetical protein
MVADTWQEDKLLMSSHDHFLELGALAAIGQLSADEDRELSQHLSQCHDCRDACSDYSAILHRHLPNASPVRFRLKHDFVYPEPASDVRERFLARARSEGAEFSTEVDRQSQRDVDTDWHLSFRPFAWAAAAAVVAIAAWTVVTSQSAMKSKATEVGDLVRQNQLLARELAVAKENKNPRVLPTVTPPNDEAERSRLQAQVQVLTARMSESSDRAKRLENRLTALQVENSSLSGAQQRNEAAIREMQKQLAQEKEGSISTIAALVEAQDKIKALNATLAERSQRLVMEQQLNSASSDVRQLMGARNLHIIDVHDVSASGQSAKSFGRVFYSEGQSLVFYAFDLPAKSAPAKYFFKAWGQMEASQRSVHELGVFNVDDHAQRRWVLKVDDARLLKGIDSVFVTAEATEDSVSPKGRRVLYAYLAGIANHP